MPQKSAPIPPSRPRFKRRSIFWFIAVALLLAAAGGLIYWWMYRKQFVREQLELAVVDGSDSLYRIRYTQMRMDEVKGWIHIRDLEVTYDSARFAQLVIAGKAPPILMRIKIPELKVNGVKTPRALLGTELAAGNVEIIRPEVQLVYTRTNDTAESRRMPTAADYDQLLGQLDKITLSKLVIHQGKLETGYLRSDAAPLQLNGVKLELGNIVVDSNSATDPDRILFASDIFLECDEVKWLSDDGRYRFRVDSTHYESKTRALRTARFNIEPLLSETQFTKQLRFADDRFDLALRGVSISGLQLASLQRDSLLADSIHLGTGHFYVYRDLGLPHDGKNRLGTYPHQLLKNAGLAIHIGQVAANAIDIKYKERSAATRKAGVVHFANTRFRINDVSNLVQETSTPMEARIESVFLQAPLSINWKFFQAASNGRFTIQGRLGQLPAPAANVLAEPMGPARLDEGTINGLSFSIDGNDYGAFARVTVLYKDLKISLLKKEEDSGELNKKKLASFAANLVMKKSNPSKKDDEPRTVKVNFRRDTKRSIFHLSWKTLFTGLKETVM